jgi:hypothetical protein
MTPMLLWASQSSGEIFHESPRDGAKS